MDSKKVLEYTLALGPSEKFLVLIPERMPRMHPAPSVR